MLGDYYCHCYYSRDAYCPEKIVINIVNFIIYEIYFKIYIYRKLPRMFLEEGLIK